MLYEFTCDLWSIVIVWVLCRYMELNVRSSSLYRKYNDDVPQYLRNRPRRLIDDMRKKMVSLDSGAITGVQVLHCSVKALIFKHINALC